MVVPVIVGVCLVIGGYGMYTGRAKVIRRFPGLTDSQQGLVLIVAGAVFMIWGIVSFI
jgi:Protein of unknown function (DUF3185)